MKLFYNEVGIGVDKKVEVNEIAKQGNLYFRNKHVRSARVVPARAGCAGCTLARHALVPGRGTAADAGRCTGRFRNKLTLAPESTLAIASQAIEECGSPRLNCATTNLSPLPPQGLPSGLTLVQELPQAPPPARTSKIFPQALAIRPQDRVYLYGTNVRHVVQGGCYGAAGAAVLKGSADCHCGFPRGLAAALRAGRRSGIRRHQRAGLGRHHRQRQRRMD